MGGSGAIVGPGGAPWTNQPFLKCKLCSVRTGTAPSFCYTCLTSQAEVSSPAQYVCPTCSHPLASDWDDCENPLCSGLAGDRRFGRVIAATTLTGDIGKMVYMIKPVDGRAPKPHYARVLDGFLAGWAERNRDELGTYDVVMPMPALSERVQEIGVNIPATLVRALALTLPELAGQFYLDAAPIVTKMHRVEARTHGNKWQERREAVKDAYQLTDGCEALVSGASVLIVDDVFVTGWNLNELAGQLVEAGASQVDALVVARSLYDHARSGEASVG